MRSAYEESDKGVAAAGSDSVAKLIAKYFLHGFSFSFLFTILAMGGIFMLIFLLLLGSIIGLIIGIIVLILIMGAANSVIADLVWGLSADLSVKILFVHGLILFVVLAVVNGIVVIAPQTYLPGTATTIVTFIAGSILDGVIGKYIAEIWGGYVSTRERQVTLYVKSPKGLMVDGRREIYKAIAPSGPRSRATSREMVYHDTLVTMPGYTLPEDQKETVEMVTEVALKYGFKVEVIDVTKQSLLERKSLEDDELIRIYPTIMIDGKRFKGTISRKQIEMLLSKARVFH